MARKPSDKEHPFGHGRMDSVATLIIAVLLFVASVELLERSVHNITHSTVSTAPFGVVLLIIGTAISP